MWRTCMTACAVALLLGLPVAHALSEPTDKARAEVTAAVRAPLRALFHRDARVFCNAFVPRVAAQVVSKGSSTRRCAQGVETLFKEAQPPDAFERAALKQIRVTYVSVKHDEASAKVRFQSGVPFPLALVRAGGRWRISTPTNLFLLPCRSVPDSRNCPPGGKVLALSFATVVSRKLGAWQTPHIEAPPSVRRAGRRQLSEFDEGRSVFTRAGCLACHRIGENGNPGPGRALTHVGSQLTERQIRHALVDPKAPMPSFRDLPPRKLHALVRFLSLLR
jgi:mono/diheme cytochrome c family protein